MTLYLCRRHYWISSFWKPECYEIWNLCSCLESMISCGIGSGDNCRGRAMTLWWEWRTFLSPHSSLNYWLFSNSFHHRRDQPRSHLCSSFRTTLRQNISFDLLLQQGCNPVFHCSSALWAEHQHGSAYQSRKSTDHLKHSGLKRTCHRDQQTCLQLLLCRSLKDLKDLLLPLETCCICWQVVQGEGG